MEVTVSRKAHFNAAHRLNNDKWSITKNEEIFGKCNYPNYHGHNYELIVSVRGEINQDTGYVMDMGKLKEIIKIEIEDRLDHKNFNLDIDYFKKVIPSAENISVFIYNILRNKIDKNLSISVTLYETPRNFVVYSG